MRAAGRRGIPGRGRVIFAPSRPVPLVLPGPSVAALWAFGDGPTAALLGGEDRGRVQVFADWSSVLAFVGLALHIDAVKNRLPRSR